MQHLSIGPHKQAGGRELRFDLNAAGTCVQFRDCLSNERHRIDLFRMHVNRAAVRLGDLKEILYEVF